MVENKEKSLASELGEKAEKAKAATSESAAQVLESVSEKAAAATSEAIAKVEEVKEVASESAAEFLESASETAVIATSEATEKVEEAKETLSENLVQTAVSSVKNTADPIIQVAEPAEKKTSVFWWGVLGFFIPLVGFILFLSWKKEESKKRKSKASGIGALIGFIVGIITAIVTIIIFMITFSVVSDSPSGEDSSFNSFISETIKSRDPLEVFVDEFNISSAEEMKTDNTFEEVYAEIEGENTVVITLVLNEENNLDADILEFLPESTMDAMVEPIVASLFDELADAGLEDFQLRFVMKNSDGTEIINSIVDENTGR